MITRMLALVVLMSSASAAFAAELDVTVSGITQSKGIIRVVVVADPDGNARQDESRNLDASLAKDGVLTTRFLGLSAGTYGVIAIEDKVVNHAVEKAVTGTVGAPIASSTQVHVILAEPKTVVSVPLASVR